MKNLIKKLLFKSVVDNRSNYSRKLYFRSISYDFKKLYLPSKTSRILSISGSDELAVRLGFDRNHILDLKYPKFDCRNLKNIDSESFDFYVSDQVLEHIGISPRKKFIEANRVVKPGGTIVISTCFYNKLHMQPNDYLRFTQDALKGFCIEQNWNVKKCGSYGTAGLAVINILGGSGKEFRFTAQYLIKLIDKLVGKSKNLYPLYTYVIAEKNI